MVTEVLLDTSIFAEMGRLRPDDSVVTFMNEWSDRAAIAATSWQEMNYGVSRLPAGRRRSFLTNLTVDIGQRFPVLPFDREAAEWHARERARLVGEGRTPPYADGQIAAVAVTNHLRLITRNVDDFSGFAGLVVESWWT